MDNRERKSYYQQWRQRHRERVRESNRHWRETHKEHIREYNIAYNKSHQEQIRNYRHKYPYNPEQARKGRERYNTKIRKDVLTHYGNGKLACVCCGYSDIRALSIDHINGGGGKHRKALGLRAGVPFYQWLRLQEYPMGYRTLCMNCQFIARF